MMRHRGKRVVVTGGASGIGAAIVARFLEEGARVAILDVDRHAIERLRSVNAAELCLHADVANEGSVADAFAAIAHAWQSVDVVVNNAGISSRARFEELSLAEWERTLAVNLTGVFLVSRAARLLLSEGSAIINISSVSGMVGMPGYLAYNVSKAGVIELTRTLALELAPRVRVVAVCPGYVLTPMQRAEYTEAQIAECAAKVPARRLALPEEIAGLVAYLGSAEASFVTGSCAVIDGGETAGGMASA
jgi:NAD(P)-dependent dehydrogenase (short-subunit alcohol dehydrogenase family)